MKCSNCNNSRKAISKINPKSIQTMKYNIINDIKFYEDYYYTFLGFMSGLTNLIKNDEYIKECYLSNFKKYEEQIINSSHSYLKEYTYYMCHYDTINPSKKKTCSLCKTDIINIIINDDEYRKLISDVIEKRSNYQTAQNLKEILYKYNFPEEFALQKTYTDYLKSKLKIHKK